MQLGKLATGKLSKTIYDKLLGSEFSQKLKVANKQINREYVISLNRYTQKFKTVALKGVDEKLNRMKLDDIYVDSREFMTLQEGKMSLMGVGLVGAIITKISAKIATKTVAKISAKTALKTSAKLATASTASLGGIVCGPASIICGIGMAAVTWFSVDAIFVHVEEYISRDELKLELMKQLNLQRDIVKNEYKKTYQRNFRAIGDKMQEDYSKIDTKKRVRDNF